MTQSNQAEPTTKMTTDWLNTHLASIKKPYKMNKLVRFVGNSPIINLTLGAGALVGLMMGGIVLGFDAWMSSFVGFCVFVGYMSASFRAEYMVQYNRLDLYDEEKSDALKNIHYLLDRGHKTQAQQYERILNDGIGTAGFWQKLSTTIYQDRLYEDHMTAKRGLEWENQKLKERVAAQEQEMNEVMIEDFEPMEVSSKNADRQKHIIL